MAKLTLETIVEFLQKIDKKSVIETQTSLNRLPEYYLGVKLSDYLNKAGYGFELEKPAKEIVKSLDVDDVKLKQTVSLLVSKIGTGKDKLIKRITNGRVDLVVLTKEKRSIKHLIELKIGSKLTKLEQDITRLIFFSKISDKSSIQRSFMVFTSSDLNESSVEDKIQKLADNFNTKINYISFKANLKGTKGRSIGKDIFVWAIEICNN
ncbi:MAG: hypothetical protein ACPG52_05755 [Cognaticolwellia sp.]